jgi:hypothetical protein
MSFCAFRKTSNPAGIPRTAVFPASARSSLGETQILKDSTKTGVRKERMAVRKITSPAQTISFFDREMNQCIDYPPFFF